MNGFDKKPVDDMNLESNIEELNIRIKKIQDDIENVNKILPLNLSRELLALKFTLQDSLVKLNSTKYLNEQGSKVTALIDEFEKKIIGYILSSIKIFLSEESSKIKKLEMNEICKRNECFDKLENELSCVSLEEELRKIHKRICSCSSKTSHSRLSKHLLNKVERDISLITMQIQLLNTDVQLITRQHKEKKIVTIKSPDFDIGSENGDYYTEYHDVIKEKIKVLSNIEAHFDNISDKAHSIIEKFKSGLGELENEWNELQEKGEALAKHLKDTQHTQNNATELAYICSDKCFELIDASENVRNIINYDYQSDFERVGNESKNSLNILKQDRDFLKHQISALESAVSNARL